MPYIKKSERANLDDAIGSLCGQLAGYTEDEIEGVLNYTISNILCRNITQGDWRYKYINRAIGVLECVKLEFYRRLAAGYENDAIAKNGDIAIYS